MTAKDEIAALVVEFEKYGYVLSEELATILFLNQKLEKPVLLEGNPGVGKTAVAKCLASHHQTDLIRLQCYEGLDVNAAIYEWNYQKQLLNIKIMENETDRHAVSREIFGMEFLLQRPLLQSITSPKPVVLLIDEVDRADEEFEAFLLEILSDFQISIPEVGTVVAHHKPFVILTSNRTRELSDALKRRCLYHWVDYPDFKKEVQILLKSLPDLDENLARQVVLVVQELRDMKLNKSPGIAESIDWARTLLALDSLTLDKLTMENSLGAVLKSQDDIRKVKTDHLTRLADLIN
ncbi:MAG: MoxR family ATPase [Cyclobacteriaceae bacterium]|nr:MoxR family ATPase [Cyclobacteriaceae bacterium]